MSWTMEYEQMAALDAVARNAVPPNSEVSVSFDEARARWVVLADVQGQRPRRILLDPEVTARADLDWASLIVQLRTKVRECFADPFGCEILIEREPRSALGFTMLHPIP